MKKKRTGRRPTGRVEACQIYDLIKAARFAEHVAREDDIMADWREIERVWRSRGGEIPLQQLLHGDHHDSALGALHVAVHDGNRRAARACWRRNGWAWQAELRGMYGLTSLEMGDIADLNENFPLIFQELASEMRRLTAESSGKTG